MGKSSGGDVPCDTEERENQRALRSDLMRRNDDDEEWLKLVVAIIILGIVFYVTRFFGEP